jgi:hypothetical protein
MWDTSDLMNTTGIIRVVSSTGIQKIDADAIASVLVYKSNGTFVGTFEARRGEVEKRIRRYGKGTYILRMVAGWRSETLKISVK